MKRTAKLSAFLVVLVAAASVLAHGYEAMPADAHIFPIGVEGTPYEGMEPGVCGGTLHVSVSSNPKSWNPHTAHETSTTWFTSKMHRGLLGFDPITGAVVPDFARSYEISDNGLVLTFSLRQDMKWSDGEPITAEDVLFTYNDVILNADVDCVMRDGQRLPNGSYPICEKVDNYTVTFTLSTVYRPILNALAFRLLPKHKLAQHVHKLNPQVPAGSFNEAWTLDTPVSELVGNGPWMVSDYQADSNVTMTRNPYYYAFDAFGTQLPYYDRILVDIVRNDDVSMLKFLNREIDVYGLRPEDIAILLPEAASKGFSVRLTDQANYGTKWFMINQDIGLSEGTLAAKRELYRDIQFREALAHLVDKESIIGNVHHGLGTAQWSPISIPSPFYAGRESYAGPISKRDAVQFEYDPSLAASKLDALGVINQDGDGWRDLPNGEALRIEINSGSNTMDVGSCQLYVEDLRAVGLNAQYQIVDFNTLVNRFFTSGVDILALGLTGGDEPHYAGGVYDSCGAMHGFRFSACRDPDPIDLRIDELLKLGTSTLDLDKAFDYYKEFQQLAAGQLGFIFSVIGTFQYAYYNHVGNASMVNPRATPEGMLAELCFDTRLKPIPTD